MPQAIVTESNADVLIVGAGPAGLFCANGLARAGVNVRIIDKRFVFLSCLAFCALPTADNVSRPVKIPAGQADGFAPRTIEVFQVSR